MNAEQKFNHIMTKWGKGDLHLRSGELIPHPSGEASAKEYAFKEARKIDPKYGMAEKGEKIDSIRELVNQEIKSDYPTKDPEIIWNEWSEEQRTHFLNDHNLNEYELFAFVNYENIRREIIKEKLIEHINEGRYKTGGKLSKVTIVAHDGEEVTVNSSGKTTDFDIRISKKEAERILGEEKLSDDKFGSIMCKEYGGDEDWQSVLTDDLDDGKLDSDYKTFEISIRTDAKIKNKKEEGGKNGTTFDGSLIKYDKDDFVAIVNSEYGWAVGEQANDILDGQEYEEQNSNALKYIAEFSKQKGEKELAESIYSYLEKLKGNSRSNFSRGGKTESELVKLFEELVPSEGASDTVEGELVRAINKIIYRYYNDGDYLYDGYGIETAGGAYEYLKSKSDSLDLPELRKALAVNGMEDKSYEDALYKAGAVIVEYVKSKEGNYTKNDDDYLNKKYSKEAIEEFGDPDANFKDEDEDEDYKTGGRVQKLKKCESGTEIQSVLLDKEYFPTERSAKTWAHKHKFKNENVDSKESTWRLRQESPSKYRKGSFRTIELSNGIHGVIACPIKKSKTSVKHKIKKSK